MAAADRGAERRARQSSTDPFSEAAGLDLGAARRAAADLARIRQDAEASRVADLARRFTMLIRACGLDGERPADAAGELDRWLLETRSCGVAALETFAAGLAQDGAAVRAALTTPWSNA